MKLTITNKQDKRAGILYFKTINSLKGHIVLYMVDYILINIITGELTIPNFPHKIPKIIVNEICMYLADQIFLIRIIPIDKEYIKIFVEYRE